MPIASAIASARSVFPVPGSPRTSSGRCERERCVHRRLEGIVGDVRRRAFEPEELAHDHVVTTRRARSKVESVPRASSVSRLRRLREDSRRAAVRGRASRMRAAVRSSDLEPCLERLALVARQVELPDGLAELRAPRERLAADAHGGTSRSPACRRALRRPVRGPRALPRPRARSGSSGADRASPPRSRLPDPCP